MACNIPPVCPSQGNSDNSKNQDICCFNDCNRSAVGYCRYCKISILCYRHQETMCLDCKNLVEQNRRQKRVLEQRNQDIIKSYNQKHPISSRINSFMTNDVTIALWMIFSVCLGITSSLGLFGDLKGDGIPNAVIAIFAIIFPMMAIPVVIMKVFYDPPLNR